jgi:transposase InsO family protein
VRYAAVERLAAGHGVRRACALLGLSPSGYYRWRRRHTEPAPRALADARLGEALRAIHGASHGAYGRPRLARELRAGGERVGERRVARLQRALGLWGGRRGEWRRAWQRRRARRTSGATAIAPNRLARAFHVGRPNERWASDATWIPTREGPLALAVVLDVGSRRVVGWATGEHLRAELTRQALTRALATRHPGAGLLHHSDQGEEYKARRYRAACAAAGAVLSMSRAGNCWDNAVVESFFASLKTERLPREPGGFATRSLAEAALLEYIEVFYNHQRRHSSLGYQSPATYEVTFNARACVQ